MSVTILKKPHAEKPVIVHEPGALPKVCDETERAIPPANLDVFVHGQHMARIYHLDEPQTGAIVKRLDCAGLMEVATLAAIHQKFDGRTGTWKVINFPATAANMMLSRGHWSLPILNGIIEAPTLDPVTGRLINTPGYDPQSRLYVAIPKPLKMTQGITGHAAAVRGVMFLSQFLAGFKFKEEGDKAAAIAMICTSLVRRLLPGAPFFVITATTPGSGKSLLTDIAAIVCTGRRASVISIGRDETEFEKRLGSVLAAADSFLAFDNLVREVGNEVLLCQLATALNMAIRLLGGSERVILPTNLTVVMNGNNVVVTGDLKRRVLLIRLAPDVERPELIKFDNDILADAVAQRDDLVRACLDIMRGYIVAGRPEVKANPVGGFELWNRTVRRALIWAGLPDPMAPAETLRDLDPALESHRQMLSELHTVFKKTEDITAGEIIRRGNAKKPMTEKEYENQGLHDALEVACGGRIDPRSLGHWLRRHAGRITQVGDNDMTLLRGEDNAHLGVATYRVQSVNRPKDVNHA